MARHHPQTQHPQTAMAQTHWVQTEPSHFWHHPQVEASDGTGTPGTPGSPGKQKWYHNNQKWWWGSWVFFFCCFFEYHLQRGCPGERHHESSVCGSYDKSDEAVKCCSCCSNRILCLLNDNVDMGVVVGVVSKLLWSPTLMFLGVCWWWWLWLWWW